MAGTQRRNRENGTNAAAHGYWGYALSFDGRSDEAIERMSLAMRMSPHDRQNSIYMGGMAVANYLAGRYNEAIDRLQMMKEKGLIYPDVYADLGIYLAQAGRVEEARKELDELLQLRERDYVPAYGLAFLYDALGETDQAMEWLGTAFEERSAARFVIIAYREWNSLRSDPRFRDLAKRSGVDPDWVPPGIRREVNDR